MSQEVPGFDDLLAKNTSRSPSGSPVAARSAFFTEELSNPFADLQSGSVARFEPPSPSAFSAVSPGTPARQPSLDPLPSPARSEPPASPELSVRHQKTPSVEEHPPLSTSNGSNELLESPRAAVSEAPDDQVLIGPVQTSPRQVVPTSPPIAPAVNGTSTFSQVDTQSPPLAPVSRPSFLDELEPSRTPQGDSESVRTVAIDSDRASVQSTSTIAVPLFDAAAKQGILISVGDPQKMGSDFIASAHTVYTVRTRVLNEGRAAFRKGDFSVLRRFSHFLWLFEQLTANNPGVIVPAPPEKVVLGRFSSEFVEHRRHALQTCLQRIVNHPMLVSDPDLRLFLESDTFSVDIKHRKTDSSGGLLASLSSAVVSPKYVEADEYFLARKQLLDSLEPQLQSLHKVLVNAAKARTTLAASTADLAAAVASIAGLSGSLPKPNRDALMALSALKRRTKELEEEQVASEEGEAGLVATVDSYVRLCASVRMAMTSRLKVYSNWQKAISTVQSIRSQHDRARARGAPPFPEAIQELNEAERRAEEAKRDFEDVSKLLKAEMVRFDTEKVEDFKLAINRHVETMVIRQRQVVDCWTAYSDVVQRAIASNPEANDQAA